MERNLEGKKKYLDDHEEKYADKGFSTRAIHAGQPPDQFYGSVNTPIHLTSTYAQVDAATPYFEFDYSRCGNPTRASLETQIASLEGGKHALAFSSGLSSNLIICHLLKHGDHVIIGDDVYGGTGRFFRECAEKVYGMEVTFLDTSDLSKLEGAIKENTKLVWLESPTNPLLKVTDIAAVAEITKPKDILLVVDNTFQTPYFQQPLSLGADIVVHSGTKYLAGHSDVVIGFAIMNNTEVYQKMFYLTYSIGPVPGPFDCYLVQRSLKTLAIRMEAINKNAQHIAEWLETQDKIERVLYPGLESHPQYELAKKQTKGNGGIVTFFLKSDNVEEARTFLKSLKIFIFAESLGGVESLAEHPALMTHASVPKEHREEIGIKDGLIRIAVGIENVEDLKADIEQALAKIKSMP